MPIIRRHLRGIAAAIAAGLIGGLAVAQAAAADPGSVSWWAERHAISIPAQTGSYGPDLAAVGQATRDAEVVGLGEGAHEIREVTGLKGRYLKYLIEKRGFRTLAWEDDWSLGTRINDYIQGRREDIRALLRGMSPESQTREVLGLLRWLRGFNDRHGDDVTFVGAEYFATRPLAYDAVENYVGRHAPGLLPQLRDAFALLRPPDDDMGPYVAKYMAIPDKEPYVRAARGVVDLVSRVKGAPEAEQALALHHAQQIRSFYVGFSLPLDQIPAYRDARAAENVAWARDYTGSRVVYWANAAHTADVRDLTITAPGEPPTEFRSAGSYLADRYGGGYVTIGFAFGRGTALDGQSPVTMPPAAPEWFESPLKDVTRSQFILNLRHPASGAVREWLDRPLITRGYPADGYQSTMSGGTLRGWCDLLVYRQVVSAATPLESDTS